MFGKWLPKETLFFDLFEQHAKITHQAAQTFEQFVLCDHILLQGNVNPIKDFEHQADKVAYRCIDTLHKSFITPLQHNDIFRLISSMDDVMDGIDEVFEDCLIYRISFFTPAAKEMSHLLLLATEKIEWIVRGLRDRKKQAPLMREAILHIHQLEDQTDQILRKALGQLFDEEQNLRLLIKWKDIYEKLEGTMDYCNVVSNIIEGIIVEYD